MEKDRYLTGNEQLELGAKVNRVADLDPETPATFHLLTDAQDIIKAVKDRVEESHGMDVFHNVNNKKKKRGRLGIFSASTNAGNLNVPLSSETQVEDLNDNPYIYRAGKYVLIKHNHGPYSELIFIPFLYANPATHRLAHENSVDTMTTTIAYLTKDRRVVGIAKNDQGNPVTIWEYRKPTKKPLREKNLLYLNRQTKNAA